VTLPEGRIVHKSLNRLRIKIESKRGNYEYFSSLKDIFSKHFSFESITINSTTGSLLFVNDIIDTDVIAEWAEANTLFKVSESEKGPNLTALAITKPLGNADAWIKRFTGGDVDLPGMIFVSLLATGIYQLLRGKVTSPPWYTAFWYALGIFSKYVIDKANEVQDL
jgi:hypothetical protein